MQLNLVIVFRTNACTICGIHPFWTKQLGFTCNATTVILSLQIFCSSQLGVPCSWLFDDQCTLHESLLHHTDTPYDFQLESEPFMLSKLAFWINAIRCAVHWTRWTLTLTSQCWLWKLVCIVEPSHNTFISKGFIWFYLSWSSYACKSLISAGNGGLFRLQIFTYPEVWRLGWRPLLMGAARLKCTTHPCMPQPSFKHSKSVRLVSHNNQYNQKHDQTLCWFVGVNVCKRKCVTHTV